MLSAENGGSWGRRTKDKLRKSFDVPERVPWAGAISDSKYSPALDAQAEAGIVPPKSSHPFLNDDWRYEHARRHHLSFSGAGRFWNTPDTKESKGDRTWWRRDQVSATSNLAGPYIRAQPPPSDSTISALSSQDFDRQPSRDGANSHPIDSPGLWEGHSISSSQLSAAEEVELISQATSPGSVQSDSLGHKIVRDDRQRKMAMHLRQLSEKEEMRARQLSQVEESETVQQEDPTIQAEISHDRANEEASFNLVYLNMPHHGDSWSTEKVLEEMALAGPTDSVPAMLQSHTSISTESGRDENLPEVYEEPRVEEASNDKEVMSHDGELPLGEKTEEINENFEDQSMFAQLKLIKQRLPYRYTNLSPSSLLLVPPNMHELSTSHSVIHRPRSENSAPKRIPRKQPNLKKYNTLQHEPFPLTNQKQSRSASDGEAQIALVDNKLKVIGLEEPLATARTSFSIEPDIDPRTGRRYVGPEVVIQRQSC